LHEDAPLMPCIPRIPRSRTLQPCENGVGEATNGIEESGERSLTAPSPSSDAASVEVTPRHLAKAVHRVKSLNVVYGPWALVARPVNRAEVARTPAAEAAVAREWQRLRSAGA
jgi:hypothetical protein